MALGASAFEEGVHAVHHLPDQAAATHCAIAATSSHLCATIVAVTPLERPVLPASDGPAEPRPRQSTPRPFRSARSRAPPSIAS